MYSHNILQCIYTGLGLWNKNSHGIIQFIPKWMIWIEESIINQLFIGYVFLFISLSSNSTQYNREGSVYVYSTSSLTSRSKQILSIILKPEDTKTKNVNGRVYVTCFKDLRRKCLHIYFYDISPYKGPKNWLNPVPVKLQRAQ